MKRDASEISPSLLTGEFTAEEIEALLARAASDPAASEDLDFLADLLAVTENERAFLEGAPALSAVPAARTLLPR